MPYVEEGTPFFAAHLRVRIAKNKSDCREEIALPGTITPHDYIVFWRKGFDDGLFFVAMEV